MKKRKGNINVVLVFAVVFAVVISNLLNTIRAEEENTREDRNSYVEQYNINTLVDLAAAYAINNMCGQTVRVPVSIFTDNVYTYQEGLDKINTSITLEARNIADILGNLEVSKYILPGLKNENIIVEMSPLIGDYAHVDNVLTFKSGDVLYLDPVTVKITLQGKKKSTIKQLTVEKIVAEIVHNDNSFAIKVEEKYSEINVRGEDDE